MAVGAFPDIACITTRSQLTVSEGTQVVQGNRTSAHWSWHPTFLLFCILSWWDLQLSVSDYLAKRLAEISRQFLSRPSLHPYTGWFFFQRSGLFWTRLPIVLPRLSSAKAQRWCKQELAEGNPFAYNWPWNCLRRRANLGTMSPRPIVVRLLK